MIYMTVSYTLMKINFLDSIFNFFVDLPNIITNEQRINYCKKNFPNFDFDRLSPYDKDVNNFKLRKP
jgi:hypothetical protein